MPWLVRCGRSRKRSKVEKMNELLAGAVKGFMETAVWLAAAAGGAVAVLVMVVCVLLLTAVVGGAFNWCTTRLARRWKRKGKRPAGRWAEIIAEGVHDDGKEQDAGGEN